MFFSLMSNLDLFVSAPIMGQLKSKNEGIDNKACIYPFIFRFSTTTVVPDSVTFTVYLKLLDTG